MEVQGYNRVYVKTVEDGVEIKPEYVYMSIPSEYICTYSRLLTLMADIGKQLLDDCNATCKGTGKNITNCWNMFQSAVACYNLGRGDEAKLLIDYINKQIVNLYRVNNHDYNQVLEVPLTEDGSLKAVCNCNNEIKIIVNPETNAAYEDYLRNKDNGRVFVKDDN